VGALGDDPADRFVDQRLPVAAEPAGQIVLAVFGGEVADQDLADGVAGLF
jgi:hypothetical protein